MKKKFNKIILSLLIISSFGYSSNDGITEMYEFVGIQTGITSANGTGTYGADATTPSIGFKYGQQTSQWRTAIYYNYAQYSDQRFHSIVAQIDYGVLTEAFAEFPFKPYVGFSIGMMKHSFDNDSNSDMIYGAGIGVNYVLNNRMDLDIGFQHMLTGSKLENLDGLDNLNLSVHYYFD
jgi:hypothetical protein